MTQDANTLPTTDETPGTDPLQGATPLPEGTLPVETKVYADGSGATGPAPLPDQSPAEQDAANAAAEQDAANAAAAAPAVAPGVNIVTDEGVTPATESEIAEATAAGEKSVATPDETQLPDEPVSSEPLVAAPFSEADIAGQTGHAVAAPAVTDPNGLAVKDASFYDEWDKFEAGAKAWDKRILEVGEHDVKAVVAAPVTLEHAIALPLAAEGDKLHKVEGLVIAAFKDVGDEIRHIYLNIHGRFVKA